MSDFKFTAALFHRVSEGKATEAERLFVIKYIRTHASDVHVVKLLANHFGALPTDTEIQPAQLSSLNKQFWEQVAKRESIPKQKINRIPTYLAVAASVLLLAVAGLFLKVYLNRNRAESMSPPLAYQKYTAPNGRRIQVLLTDGTLVHLNSGSTLSVPTNFCDTLRAVTLMGEAFFEVTHDTRHPFSVKAGEIKTTVLGTKFDVKAYPEDERSLVTVVTGKVRVSSTKKILGTLTHGYQVDYNKSQQSGTVAQVDATEYVDWQTGQLRFSGKLKDFKTVLERRYGIAVRFTDSSLADYSYTVNLDNPSLKRLLTVMKFTRPFHYRLSADTLYLTH